MTAPKPFPSNLWRKELNVPHWTLSLKWSAEIVCTKKGWRAKAAMKPFLQIQSNVNYDTKEDAMSSIQGLFEGFYINPWESGVGTRSSTLSRIARGLLSKSRPPAAGFSGFR